MNHVRARATMKMPFQIYRLEAKLRVALKSLLESLVE